MKEEFNIIKKMFLITMNLYLRYQNQLSIELMVYNRQVKISIGQKNVGLRKNKLKLGEWIDNVSEECHIEFEQNRNIPPGYLFQDQLSHNQIFITQNKMKNTPKLILVVALLTVMTLSDEVKISCKQDTSCSAGSAYELQINGNTKSFCMDTTCPLGFSAVYDYRPCEYDYYGVKCSTNYCFAFTKTEMCMDQSFSQCPTLSYTYKCGDCSASMSSCTAGQCMTQESTSLEVCYYTECFSGSMALKYEACENGKDNFGYQCSCCFLMELQDSELDICSSALPYTNDQIQQFMASSYVYEGLMKLDYLFIMMTAVMAILHL